MFAATKHQVYYRSRRKQPRWVTRLLWLEPLWLLLLAPSILFTTYFWNPILRPLFVLALFLFWPLRLAFKQHLLPKPPLGWFVGFLLFWLPISLWASPDQARSWEIAGYIMFGIVTFIALLHWPVTRHHPALIVLLLGGVAVGLALVGPESFSINPRKFFDLTASPIPRPTDPSLWGKQINPNILASMLVLVLPLLVALFLRWDWSRFRWLPPLLGLPILLLGNALVLTQSRAGYFAAAVSLVLLLCLRWPRLAYSLSFLILGSLVFIIPAWELRSLWQTTDSASAIGSLNGRLEIWKFALAMFSRSPLAGIGLGVFDLQLVTQFPYLATKRGFFIPPHAHNLWLQLALDLGIPGLLAALGLLGNIIYQFSKQIAQRSHALTWALAARGLSAMAAMLSNGLFDIALWGTRLTVLPWCLYALAVLNATKEKG